MRELAKICIAIVATGALVLLTPATAQADAPTTCSEQDRRAGRCVVEGTLTDDSAVLSGTQPGSGGGGSNGSTGGGSGGGGSSAEPALTPEQICMRTPNCRTTFTVTSLPTPTLSDLVGFRPTPGVDHMEPNGWFVVGLDANFYATGGTSVQSGPLLGYPASVRFTPIRWKWTYGDGNTATRSTAGSTWAGQGIAEFDPTSTSHVYERAGTYYIDLTLGYRVEYTFNGSSWAPIAGMLWLPANRLVATVGGAKTVLVERECSTAPAGPGC